MRVVFFNAPPHSGKDTLADHLAGALALNQKFNQKFDVRRTALAEPLYNGVFSLFNIPVVEQQRLARPDVKDVPQDRFRGKSLRQMLIWLSQDVVKPIFGLDFWARAVLDPIKERDNLHLDSRCNDGLHKPMLEQFVIISDLGFHEELDYAVEVAGRKNVLILHIDRPGFTYANDSRRKVMADPDAPVASLTIRNDLSIRECALNVERTVYDWLYEHHALDFRVPSPDPQPAVPEVGAVSEVEAAT